MSKPRFKKRYVLGEGRVHQDAILQTCFEIHEQHIYLYTLDKKVPNGKYRLVLEKI